MKLYLWGILASMIAIGLETLYRSSTKTWVEHLPITFVPILLLNLLLYLLLTESGSLLGAFILFSACNLLLRISVVLVYLREPVSRGTWIAMILLMLAQVSKRFL